MSQSLITAQEMRRRTPHGGRARSNGAARRARVGPGLESALPQRILPDDHLRRRQRTRLLLLDRPLEPIPNRGHRCGHHVVRHAQLPRFPGAVGARHRARPLPSGGRGQGSPREHRAHRHGAPVPRSQRHLPRRRCSGLPPRTFVRPTGSAVRPHDRRLHGHPGRRTDLGSGRDRGSPSRSADMAEHNLRPLENLLRADHRLGPLGPRGGVPLPDACVERERPGPRFRAPAAGAPRVRAPAPAPNSGTPTHVAVLPGQLRRGRDRLGGFVSPPPVNLCSAREQRWADQRRLLLRRFNRRGPPIHHPGRGVHLVLRGGVPRGHGSARRGAESHAPQPRSPRSGDRRDVRVLGNNAAVVR